MFDVIGGVFPFTIAKNKICSYIIHFVYLQFIITGWTDIQEHIPSLFTSLLDFLGQRSASRLSIQHNASVWSDLQKIPPSMMTIIPSKHICIAFIQCWTNVEDIGPTLYKCYTNVLCLLCNNDIFVLFLFFELNTLC